MSRITLCVPRRSLFLFLMAMLAGAPDGAIEASPCGPTPLAPVCWKPVCTYDGWDYSPLPYGTSCNSGAGICDGQGSCMVAYGKITGNFEGVPSSGGQPRIAGWACAKYVAQSIAVHVYAGGPAGSGTFVTAATANVASEPAIAQACFVSGGAYRFSIPITPSMVSQFKSSSIYIHGISPVGTPNDLLPNSGSFTFPDGAVIGNIDSLAPASPDGQRVTGWACARGVTGSIAVHVYAGGAAGTGTYVTSAVANVASEPAVAQACKMDGAGALRFDIPFSAAVSYQFRNKKIYIHGISPIGGTNNLIANSGTFAFPCPAPPWRYLPVYADPQILFNTTNISYCPYNFSDVVGHLLPGGLGVGSENDHWHYVWENFPYYLNTASGLVVGGAWTDEAGCARDGLSCPIPQGTLPQPRAGSSACSYPTAAHDDFAMHHRDRDFNMQLLPLRPDGNIDGSLLGLANKAAANGGLMPALGIEAEWMYLYPRQGQPRFWTNLINGAVWRTSEPSDFFISNFNTGETKALPPLVLNKDGWRGDFPVRGDQAAVRGVLIFDCGHSFVGSDGFQYGYLTELHPAVAMTWLHRQDSPKTSTVQVKAMSHAPYPSLTHAHFDQLATNFQLPDYDPSLPVCIGPVHADYNLVKTAVWNIWLGEHFSSDQPYAYFSGSGDRSLDGDWTISLTHAGSGKLAFSVAPRFADDSTIPGVEPDFPLLMGAHIGVCQPARDATGAKINACPDDCGGCIPRTCASANAACGSIDDGCGGSLWCGQCIGSWVCNASSQCELPPTPDPGPCPVGTLDCCGDHLCRASCDFACY